MACSLGRNFIMSFYRNSSPKMNPNNHKRRKAIAKRIKELRINSGHGSYETFTTDNGLSRKTIGA